MAVLYWHTFTNNFRALVHNCIFFCPHAEISMLVFDGIVNCSQYSADTEEQWKCIGDSGYSGTCSRVGTYVGSTVAQQGLRSPSIFTGATQ